MDLVMTVFGPETSPLTWWQVAARGVVVFAALILFVRVGARRMFAKLGPVDIALAVLIGSGLSRAMTGNAALVPTLVGSAVLVALHALLSHLAASSHMAARVIEGSKRQLVADGRVVQAALDAAGLSEEDVREALRASAGTSDLGQVRAAYLERNGRISFVRR